MKTCGLRICIIFYSFTSKDRDAADIWAMLQAVTQDGFTLKVLHMQIQSNPDVAKAAVLTVSWREVFRISRIFSFVFGKKWRKGEE